MQTSFTPAQLADPAMAASEKILRTCVHCGFCTATCPTYQLLGDELDGPRGRIYLVKQVLEGVEPTAKTQTHLDRCLTCRSCETTCPSGVQYGRLLDIGRALDASNERYGEVFRASLDGLAMLRRDGTIVDVNPAMLALCGYPPAALV